MKTDILLQMNIQSCSILIMGEAVHVAWGKEYRRNSVMNLSFVQNLKQP